MESKKKKILTVLTVILVILAGVSVVVLLNLKKVQEIYDNLTGKEDEEKTEDLEEQEDLTDPETPEEPLGEEKPISQALSTLLYSSSQRRIGSMTTVVASDSEFYALIGTPIAVGYKGTVKDASPLLISGEAANKFLDIYNTSEVITIGTVKDVTSKYSFSGNEKSASLAAAKQIWKYSNGALIIENSREGYEIGVVVTCLASYLNIPVIVTNEMDNSVVEILSGLGVDYTLVCGNLEGYCETFYFSSLTKAYDLILEYLNARFKEVSYITLINSEDVNTDYGIPEISCLAPYLSSSYEGIVLNCPEPRLPEDSFLGLSDNTAIAANEIALTIKDKLLGLLDKVAELDLYDQYMMNNPYLAILGDPYSIPFYYIKDPDSDPMDEDSWLATDDYYSDLESDLLSMELAQGRVLSLSLGGVSALISRSLFYDDYMENWEADSRVSDAKGAEWRDTAYVAKGDDWNGAAWLSTGDYWQEVNYLQDHGYTVQTTQRRGTGATVSQEILKYYSSSSLIYVLAHGSPYSYQLTDSVDSSDVRSWDLGPSVQVLTSCSAARTDVSDIEETISLAFIEVGENAFIGGTRTESSGSSPTLSAYFIENIVASDETVGISHRDAKNRFTGESESKYDASAIRILYGDPAFNPYQP